MKVTPEAFIRIWQTSSKTSEVERLTGMKKGSCSTRASQYRKHGVPLKRYERDTSNLIHMKPLDWTKLIGIAKEGVI